MAKQEINLSVLSHIIDCFIPHWYIDKILPGIINGYVEGTTFTEKLVGWIRRKQIPSTSTRLLTGSSVECLRLSNMKARDKKYESFVDYINSDVDIMIVDNVKVGYHDDGNDLEYVITTDHTYPEYLWLRKAGEMHQYKSNDLCEELQQLDDNWKNCRKLFNGINNLEYSQSGPAITTRFGSHSFDDVYAHLCPVWPTEAMNWRKRALDTGWPCKEVVQDIINEGCLIVHKPYRFSINPSIEWRFSFSVAEARLARTLTMKQKQCFVVFKMLVKLAQSENGEPGLSTYCSKTVFFWMLQKIPQTDWEDPDTGLGSCFVKLLDEFLACLSRKCIPHFFVPANNILSHIDTAVIQKTYTRVLKLRDSPLKWILKFDEMFLMEGLVAPDLYLSDILLNIEKLRHCSPSSSWEDEKHLYSLNYLKACFNSGQLVGAWAILSKMSTATNTSIFEIVAEIDVKTELNAVGKLCIANLYHHAFHRSKLCEYSSICENYESAVQEARLDMTLYAEAVINYCYFLMRIENFNKALLILNDYITIYRNENGYVKTHNCNLPSPEIRALVHFLKIICLLNLKLYGKAAMELDAFRTDVCSLSPNEPRYVMAVTILGYVYIGLGEYLQAYQIFGMHGFLFLDHNTGDLCSKADVCMMCHIYKTRIVKSICGLD